MLVEFRFGNFRSFKDVATLSMVAASKIHSDPGLDPGNVVTARKGLDLLKVAAIYGANGSGKSNLIQAFSTFRRIVEESANIGFKSGIAHFFFDVPFVDTPTTFEVTMFDEDTLYRYG
jgi:uncharacterized protein